MGRQKRDAVGSLLRPSRGTLIPTWRTRSTSKQPRTSLSRWRTLKVLKILQKAYNDQVKLIYIDPPYNTGNDFVYNDNFSDGLRGYLSIPVNSTPTVTAPQRTWMWPVAGTADGSR